MPPAWDSPYVIINVMICVRVGKEFPYMRQNERRIKFIREGDAVRIAGWLKGKPNPFIG